MTNAIYNRCLFLALSEGDFFTLRSTKPFFLNFGIIKKKGNGDGWRLRNRESRHFKHSVRRKQRNARLTEQQREQRKGKKTHKEQQQEKKTC